MGNRINGDHDPAGGVYPTRYWRPGDIIVDRPGLKVFFPITTMIVLSLVLSLVLWLFRR